jgi:glycosyltransferase involved in cell wall biosynthesis
VDGEHFGKARLTETPLPQDVAELPRPILGYFGVVDERLDYELIARLAKENGAGSVVLVGPTIKVDEGALPRGGNLHWLGKRDYAELPGYSKAFDVCLMPFALNAATEYINPTKALEYMATGKPIVSTPVADVVRNFGQVVRIGKTAEEFVALCRQAAEQPDTEAIQRGFKMVEANSWERIVGDLERHVEEAMRSSRSEVRSPK